jgi:hypothetical protein
MAADPRIVYALRLQEWKKGRAEHPGPPPEGMFLPKLTKRPPDLPASRVPPRSEPELTSAGVGSDSVGGPHDGEDAGQRAIRSLKETATQAADTIIAIAKDKAVAPATRLNAAKYIIDMCRETKGADGDNLMSALRLFGSIED